MTPTITLGPLVLPTAVILYIVGAWFVLTIIERTAKALRLNAEHVYGLAATALVAGFVGARLVFVALHWPAYRNNLIGIVWPITGGYDLWGGLIFALVSAVLYGRAKRLPLATTLDALAPGLLIGLIVVSLADLFAGPGYGTESSMPWALEVFGIKRHPVQVYEIMVALIALLVWWVSYQRQQFPGQMFLSATVTYAAGRLIVDAYRANSPLTDSGYHIVQFLSLGVLLVAIFFLGRLSTQSEDSQELTSEST